VDRRSIWDDIDVYDVQFSSDGLRVFGATGPVVHLETGTVVRTDQAAAISPDGRLFVTEDLEVFDVDTGTLIARLPHSLGESPNVRFSTDGSTILAFGEGTLQTWPTPFLGDGRSMSRNLCEGEIAGGLRLSAADVEHPLVRGVLTAADQQPCNGSSAFSWQGR
jgi:WD40 repeat protein